MQSDWKWDKLDPLERRVAELLVQGKANAPICAEVFLSRLRVQDCIKRILIKTGADSTRGAIALLVEERETLSLLRVLEQATDGVIILQDRLVKFANTALERIHGYEANGIAGIPFVELAAPGSRGTITKHYELRMQGEPAPTSYAIRILCKGGQEKDAMVASAGQIRYCGRPAVLGIIASLEVEKRESQTLRVILEQARAGVVIVQDHVVKFANKAMQAMLGYDLEEMVGMPFIELVAPRSRDAALRQHELRLKGEPFSTLYVIGILCKDGQEKDVEVANAGQIQYMGGPAIMTTAIPHVAE